jgi:hypothetical protein
MLEVDPDPMWIGFIFVPWGENAIQAQCGGL